MMSLGGVVFPKVALSPDGMIGGLMLVGVEKLE
jgi:hypothetical protein